MSKFTAIVLTAVVCLPLGALLRGDASADRRLNDIGFSDSGFTYDIVDHPHLSRARAALDQAVVEIEASQRLHEPLWSDRTGRAAAMKTAIKRAAHTTNRTTDWVMTGMIRNAPEFGSRFDGNPFQRTLIVPRP